MCCRAPARPPYPPPSPLGHTTPCAEMYGRSEGAWGRTACCEPRADGAAGRGAGADAGAGRHGARRPARLVATRQGIECIATSFHVWVAANAERLRAVRLAAGCPCKPEAACGEARTRHTHGSSGQCALRGCARRRGLRRWMQSDGARAAHAGATARPRGGCRFRVRRRSRAGHRPRRRLHRQPASR